MQQILRRFLTLGTFALMCVAQPAAAQQFLVGTFTKPATTGAQNQTVNLASTMSGLTAGCTCAVIFWTNGNITNNTAISSYWWAFGVTDGTNSRNRSVAASSQNNAGTSNSSRRSAAKALTIVQYSEALQAEFDMQSPTPWDTTHLYLNWTTSANTTAYIIHYLIMTGLTGAQVADWTAATAGSNKTVTLASPAFQPDVVIHFMGYDTAAPPSSIATAAFTLGVMDAGSNQWTTAFVSTDNLGTSGTGRAQRYDAMLESISCATNCTPTETIRAHFVSMNADGFTVNFDVNTTGLAYHVFSLALKGLNVHADHFDKKRSIADSCPATCTQTIPASGGFGFAPKALLLASFQSPHITSPSDQAPAGHARLGFGAFDGSTGGVTAITDQNNAGTSVARAIDHIDDIFDVVNNDTASLNSRANETQSTLDADTFTLKWTVNDDAAAEMLYLVFGQMSPTAVMLTSFTATAMPDGRTRIAWRTGYEVDNVGFRVYREQKGVRVPITTSIVPGSALIGAARGASSGGQIYSWSDVVPPDAGPVQYWLEDVDLKGKSTWHGPIAPGAGTPPVRPAH